MNRRTTRRPLDVKTWKVDGGSIEISPYQSPVQPQQKEGGSSCDGGGATHAMCRFPELCVDAGSRFNDELIFNETQLSGFSKSQGNGIPVFSLPRSVGKNKTKKNMTGPQSVGFFSCQRRLPLTTSQFLVIWGE